MDSFPFTNMQNDTAPDVEAPRARDGDTHQIQIAVWIVAALAISLVTLRIFYHLVRGRRHLWSDDHFLIAALLCLIGNAIAIQEWIPDKLEPNVTTAAPYSMVLAGSFMGLFNSLSLALIKTSLAITFMRLTSGWWKSGLGLYVFVLGFLYIIQGWSFWVQDCDGPPEPYRTQSARSGCLSFDSVRNFRLIVQILSCSLDAYFTVLPWIIVRSLELKRWEKFGLAIAMSFGCASLASGLVRLTVLARLVHQPYDHQPFYAVGGYLFNYFEPGFSIVAACMPVLRKVIMDIIRWKKDTPLFRLNITPRKKRRVKPTLPVTEDPEGTIHETEANRTLNGTVVNLTAIKVPTSLSSGN